MLSQQVGDKQLWSDVLHNLLQHLLCQQLKHFMNFIFDKDSAKNDTPTKSLTTRERRNPLSLIWIKIENMCIKLELQNQHKIGRKITRTQIFTLFDQCDLCQRTRRVFY